MHFPGSVFACKCAHCNGEAGRPLLVACRLQSPGWKEGRCGRRGAGGSTGLGVGRERGELSCIGNPTQISHPPLSWEERSRQMKAMCAALQAMCSRDREEEGGKLGSREGIPGCQVARPGSNPDLVCLLPPAQGCRLDAWQPGVWHGCQPCMMTLGQWVGGWVGDFSLRDDAFPSRLFLPLCWVGLQSPLLPLRLLLTPPTLAGQKKRGGR